MSPSEEDLIIKIERLIYIVKNRFRDKPEHEEKESSLISRIYMEQSYWYHNMYIRSDYENGAYYEKAICFSPKVLSLYCNKAYFISTSKNENKWDIAKQLLELALSIIPITSETDRYTLNSTYYNLAESYILSDESDLQKAIEYLNLVDFNIAPKSTIVKDFEEWKNKLNGLPDNDDKLEILNIIAKICKQ